MLASVASSLFGLLLLLLSTASADAPSRIPSNGAHLLEERQNSFTLVTGVRQGGDQPRLEVRQMYNTKPDQWNIFLLGMQRMQRQAQSNKLSFYQIAGIHGVPNVPWDGVTQNPASGGAVGYCTHSSVLFPAWHRPYLALFEQALYDNVQAVVATFPAGPRRDAYAAAAQTLRLPYWDWAAAPPSGLPTLPLIISSKYATVNTPGGIQTIINPLFRYDFNPLVASDMLYQPWTNWPVTLRWPTNNGSAGLPPASSQNNLAQNAIENSRLNRRDAIYNMFTLCSDYLEFSNDQAASSSQGCHTSLESIHNQIHSLVGGSNNGHMTWLWWGALDPVFFLHHANVDRLFAMWQAIYPNSYGASQVAPGSTYTIARGSLQTADSPLTPFHATASGSFWTTNSARNVSAFGYTYPEFVNGSSTAKIRSIVNQLYGPSATGIAGSVKRDLTSTGLATPNQGLTWPLAGGNVEYVANVVLERWALNGSYTIYFFMGKPREENAHAYPFANNLIGSFAVFANPGMGMNHILSAGSVPLTRALRSQIGGGLLQSLSRLLVVPFLQAALEWRVATTNGQIIPNDLVPGLEVSVVTADYTPPSSANAFPIYRSFNTLPDITDRKAGGLRFNMRPACER